MLKRKSQLATVLAGVLVLLVAAGVLVLLWALIM
jgi:hypothetical protein